MADVSRPAAIDTVIIGSGPGGYVAGIRLGQLGSKAAVVEREQPGGVCLNVGCIPSKALIHVAKLASKMTHGQELGIEVTGHRVNWKTTQAWKASVVHKLTSGVKQLLKANGTELIVGDARIAGPGSILVTQAGGKTLTVSAKNIIIATGSRPIEIPGFVVDQETVLDSTGALALDEIPKRLVVIGGGYIGLELGTVYAKLGSKVTVLEALPSILTGMEPECTKHVGRALKKLGVEVVTEATAKSWEHKGDRAVVTVVLKDGKTAAIDADKILVTVGRRPNTDQVGLEKIGVKLDARGFIETDAQQRTNVPGVYAIGDCTTGMMLAHKASKEGEVAAEVIAGRKAAMDARAIPAVVFTDPEIASAGLSEAQAQEAGHEVVVGKFPFAALGRALSVHDSDGFAKIVADKTSGEVLGVHIVGNGASDMIAEGVLAIEMGAVLHDLALTVHAHPTMPEALMEAAKAALGEAIHIVNR